MEIRYLGSRGRPSGPSIKKGDVEDVGRDEAARLIASGGAEPANEISDDEHADLVAIGEAQLASDPGDPEVSDAVIPVPEGDTPAATRTRVDVLEPVDSAPPAPEHLPGDTPPATRRPVDVVEPLPGVEVSEHLPGDTPPATQTRVDVVAPIGSDPAVAVDSTIEDGTPLVHGDAEPEIQPPAEPTPDPETQASVPGGDRVAEHEQARDWSKVVKNELKDELAARGIEFDDKATNPVLAGLLTDDDKKRGSAQEGGADANA